MRTLFRIGSGIIPSSFLIKGIKRTIAAPFYHLVSDNPPPHVKHLYRVLSIKDFEKDLEFLLKHFQPINANTLSDILTNKKDNGKASLFLSFDDGFIESKEVIAPILQKKGVPATFFVNPAYIDSADLMYRCKVSLAVDRIEAEHFSKIVYSEIAKLLGTLDNLQAIKSALFQLKHNQNELILAIAKKINLDFNEYLQSAKPYLTHRDLQELSDLNFTIGGHGYNHPYFNELSFNEQLNEVETCMKWVNYRFPNQSKLFAFPFTDFGVSDDLIKRIVLEPNSICDVSFGTSGIQPIRFGKHLQRIPMEEGGKSGQNIIRGEILYYLAKKGIGHYKRIND